MTNRASFIHPPSFPIKYQSIQDWKGKKNSFGYFLPTSKHPSSFLPFQKALSWDVPHGISLALLRLKPVKGKTNEKSVLRDRFHPMGLFNHLCVCRWFASSHREGQHRLPTGDEPLHSNARTEPAPAKRMADDHPELGKGQNLGSKSRTIEIHFKIHPGAGSALLLQQRAE